jgi:hypothetical protein
MALENKHEKNNKIIKNLWELFFTNKKYSKELSNR